MKLLYISHLSTNVAAGLNWSVPAGVDAQSMVDEVLWVNMTDVLMPHWKKVKAYHNIKEFGGKLKTLDILPEPFNCPDVVIFEGFYNIYDVFIAKMLKKHKIPYVIIPRGSLTKLALHNQAWLKKKVAHVFFFDRYVKNAAAIQYLTKQEAVDSIRKFHTNYFIVPNGFNEPKKKKENFSKDGIKAVFIGRLDMFHKGLDLLLEAMTHIRPELIKAHFFLDIYGPRRYDFYKIEKEIAEKKLTDIAAIHDEISGKEKEEVLLNSDLFIMTSRFEGHPMGLIEALVYGLPCLVTPGTNMAEEIKVSNAGWVCEGSPLSIATSLKSVIEERDQFKTKSYNGRNLSRAYSWEQIAKAFHNKLVQTIKIN